jgi:SAM-dependent methyltransferase
MPRPFAIHYDTIYADKDYAADIEAVSQLLAPRLMTGSRVLEIGAGTGNHSFALARLVKSLLSVEIDSDFADIFERKLASYCPENLTFDRRPIEEIDAGGFDASLALFHVLNYLQPDNLQSFCDAVAAKLCPGGAFIADIWNGTAALLDPPRRETRLKEREGARITQKIDPHFQSSDRKLRLDYKIEMSDGTKKLEFGEQLHLLLWTPEEIVLALRQAGFAEIHFWDYRNFPAPARPDSWRLWLKAHMPL